MKLAKEIKHKDKNYVIELLRDLDSLTVRLSDGNEEAEWRMYDCWNLDTLWANEYYLTDEEEENFQELRQKYLDSAFEKIKASLEEKGDEFLKNLFEYAEGYRVECDGDSDLTGWAGGLAYEIYLESIGPLFEAVREMLGRGPGHVISAEK